MATISEITALWEKIQSRLKSLINDNTFYDSLFGKSFINDITSDTITLVVDSHFAKTLISTKYDNLLRSAVNDVCDVEYKIKVLTKDELNQKKKNEAQISTNTNSSYFSKAKLNPQLNFDTFVIGDFNREAALASQYVANDPGKYLANPLFIYSNSGLGKTHLLHAIGNKVKANKPEFNILYISASDFIDEYVNYVKGEKEAQSLKDFFSSINILLIDDVQMLADKVETQKMFFTIYNNLVDNNKQIVITSDKQPFELKGMEDRLITRFSKGLTVKIEEPDTNTCVEILKKKLTSAGMDVNKFDENVLRFFADKFSNNVRELEGALHKLLFYITTHPENDRITMDVAIEAISSLTSGKSLVSQINEQKIINTVADYYSLTPSQITGKDRSGQVALARHIAMYLIRYKLDIPLKKIGDAFGGKDHTTVMNAITKVDKGLKTDPQLKEAITHLQNELK